ncbi:hypothetical protein BASA81_000231 [Batrachochytrium salamandrivorans]|nr:hypothetical protein BASA81_000231 [Batrachochytrium salamandrivorans]
MQIQKPPHASPSLGLCKQDSDGEDARYFSSTQKRAPTQGFSQTKKHRSSELPWEAFVAESLNGKNTECLLCGRVSARNPWRTRAHFMGGDAHVQLCPQLTQEVVDYMDTLGVFLPDKRKSAQISPLSQSSAGPSSPKASMPPLDLALQLVPLSAGTVPASGHSKCLPKLGFEMDTSPEAMGTWRTNLAFNKSEAKAQCLLCNRISKNNPARLRAHFWGGDKHVAVCPFVSRAQLNGGGGGSDGEDDKSRASKRKRLDSTDSTEQGFLHCLLAAVDVVEERQL